MRRKGTARTRALTLGSTRGSRVTAQENCVTADMATGGDETNPRADGESRERPREGEEDAATLMRRLLTALEGQGKTGTSTSGKSPWAPPPPAWV